MVRLCLNCFAPSVRAMPFCSFPSFISSSVYSLPLFFSFVTLFLFSSHFVTYLRGRRAGQSLEQRRRTHYVEKVDETMRWKTEP